MYAWLYLPRLLFPISFRGCPFLRTTGAHTNKTTRKYCAARCETLTTWRCDPEVNVGKSSVPIQSARREHPTIH